VAGRGNAEAVAVGRTGEVVAGAVGAEGAAVGVGALSRRHPAESAKKQAIVRRRSIGEARYRGDREDAERKATFSTLTPSPSPNLGEGNLVHEGVSEHNRRNTIPPSPRLGRTWERGWG
jgi:hypothetical protein